MEKNEFPRLSENFFLLPFCIVARWTLFCARLFKVSMSHRTGSEGRRRVSDVESAGNPEMMLIKQFASPWLPSCSSFDDVVQKHISSAVGMGSTASDKTIPPESPPRVQGSSLGFYFHFYFFTLPFMDLCALCWMLSHSVMFATPSGAKGPPR